MKMVEKVARAMCATNANPDEIMPNGGARWRYYVPQALAAIEAMREPTDGMIAELKASYENSWFNIETNPWAIDADVGTWQRLIDAALEN